MDKKDLSTWFESLSEEEKEVVKLRFGINREEPLTLKEISLKLRKKVNNVNFFEINAIQKLRELLLIK